MSQVLKLESNTHQTNINSNNNKIQPDKSNKSKTQKESSREKYDMYPKDNFYILCKALDDFCSHIPEDYVNYGQINEICIKIKDSLSYTAPEELIKSWRYKGIVRLIPYMPNPPASWVYKAWDFINKVSLN